VTPGCLDMVNFWAPDTISEKFNGRNFFEHNPQVTLMRSSKEECIEMAKFIATKLNAYQGKVSFLIPTKGLSMIAIEGEAFYDPEADLALFDTLKQELNDSVEVLEVEAAVNDALFAEACVNTLLTNIADKKKVKSK
jgi:uncharacterized protein (UPF0261 family)